MRLVWILVVLSLAGCDPFPEVRKVDTIEGYEAYIAEHADSTFVSEARARLEVLYLEKARAERTLEAYDAYTSKFPQGVYRKEAYIEREAFMWAWADATNTADAWERYLKEYPSHDARKVKDARRRKECATYLPNLAWTPVAMKKVNLAEDPNGELNGWMFSSDVTNNGPQTITYLQLTLRFKDTSGKTIGDARWPVVSENYGIPVEEEKKIPIKPGETRTWSYTTGDIPPGWSEQTELVATGILFQEYAPR
jgi:hypothetical protein